MRITFAVTMALFLLPTVYVVKYYAADRPREEALARPGAAAGSETDSPDWLRHWERVAREGRQEERQVAAVQTIGRILRQPGVDWKRPLECLSAKATLSELATKAPSAAVRSAASAELDKVAQGGAVLRR